MNTNTQARICGVPVVKVTQLRIKKNERKPYLYYYDIRHEDEDWGEPWSIEKRVLVNHFGTIVTSEPILEIENANHRNYILLTSEEKQIIFDHL